MLKVTFTDLIALIRSSPLYSSDSNLEPRAWDVYLFYIHFPPGRSIKWVNVPKFRDFPP